jgi:4'-phosphopantetheinyl transferase EntD
VSPQLSPKSTPLQSPFVLQSGTIEVEKANDHAWHAIWQGFDYQEILRLIPGLPEGDLHYLSNIAHPHNRAGSTAARLLCQYLMAYMGLPYPGLGRDLHGKPLMPPSDLHSWQISLSHAVSGGLAAVLLSKEAPCGIDLETVRQKTLTLAPRYMALEELAYWQPRDADLACMLWCLKEAAYKRFSHKGLSLRDHLRISKGVEPHMFDVHSLLHDETIVVEARRLKTAWLAWSC